MWRLALGVGAVPSMIALLFRFQMEEPPSTESRNVMNYFGNLQAYVKIWPTLLGCCLSWGVYNFSFFGMTIIESVICEHIFGVPDENRSIVMRDAEFAIVMSAIIQVGNGICWIICKYNVPYTFFLAFGFFFFAIFTLLSGICINLAWLPALFFMFGHLFVAVLSVCTYLVPAEAIPTSVRASGIGLAAASGKIGGCIGTAIFASLAETHGVRLVLIISGCVGFAGIGISLGLLPKTLKTGAE